MKKNWAKPIVIGAIYALCLTFFILMTATKLGAVKLAEMNGGYGMFDTKFFYSPQKFYEILAILGAEGSRHYLQTHMFDYAFLTLFVIVQFTILNFLYSKLQLSAKCNWIFLPIVGEFFADIAENLTIDVLIRWEASTQKYALVRFASAMTILKWLFLAAWIISVVTLIVIFFLKRLKKMNEDA